MGKITILGIILPNPTYLNFNSTDFFRFFIDFFFIFLKMQYFCFDFGTQKRILIHFCYGSKKILRYSILCYKRKNVFQIENEYIFIFDNRSKDHKTAISKVIINRNYESKKIKT